MTGLTDYIKWMGRLSFSQLPLGELDAMVLCVLSYFDLRPGTGASTVRDCAVGLARFDEESDNAAVLREAAASRRFGELLVTGYENVFRPEVPLQFAAVTFSHGGEFSFLAFRGTDATIAGWREDFMISFTRTEAQRMAADYAARAVTPGRRYYLGGHSKGGNLALYAACTLDGAAWDRVERVFILDGPGLCPEVMDASAVARVDEKAIRVVPAYCVIGKLFEPHIADTRIVRSSARGILQHSLATWGVEYGQLAAAEKHERQSEYLSRTINAWIEGMAPDDRLAMTNELFDALAAGGAVTLRDIAGKGPGGFESVLSGLLGARKTQRMVRELAVSAVVDTFS